MMKQKYFFILAVFFLLSVASGVDAKTSQVFLKPKNFTVQANTTLVLPDNKPLIVRGDLTVRGAIECKNGALNLEVYGNLRVSGTLKCIRTSLTKAEPLGNGIVIVGKKAMIFEDSALVVTNGHLQLADHENRLARTQQQIDALYKKLNEDAGAPFQIGPLAAEGAPVLRAGLIGLTPGTPSAPQTPLCTLTPPTVHPKPGIPGGIGIGPRVPPKQVPQLPQNPAPSPQLPKGKECFDAKGKPVPNCIQIGGTWVLGGGGTVPGKIVVPASPKNVKRIILNYGFGAGKEVVLKDLEIVGPPAPDGEEKKPSCTAIGEDGYTALRFGAKAPSITVHNFIMRLGKGGDGANAATPECRDRAMAKGGDGGTSGNLKLEAEKTLKITGSLCIFPGDGGNGGSAKAFGAKGDRGCHGTRGGSAEATGGKGADNKKELRVYGSVQGTSNIYVGPLIGGNGGEAYAKAGSGGDGELSVGDPGGATAAGGAGGVAHLATWGVQRVPGGEDKDGVQVVGTATQGSKGSATIIPCTQDVPTDGGGGGGSSGGTTTPPYRFSMPPSGLPYGSGFDLILEGKNLATKLPLQFTVLVGGRMQDLPRSEVSSADELGTDAASVYIPQIKEAWRGQKIEFQARAGNGEILATWSSDGN